MKFIKINSRLSKLSHFKNKFLLLFLSAINAQKLTQSQYVVVKN